MGRINAWFANCSSIRFSNRQNFCVHLRISQFQLAILKNKLWKSEKKGNANWTLIWVPKFEATICIDLKICANLTMVSDVHVSIFTSNIFFEFSLISSSINHKLSAMSSDKIYLHLGLSLFIFRTPNKNKSFLILF